MWSKLRDRLAAVKSVIRRTLDGYVLDRGDLMAAALAFYTLISIAPLVLIAGAVGGFVLGGEAAREEISRLLNGMMGEQAARSIDSLANAWAEASSRSGRLASWLGGGLMLFTASRLVAQLRRALNQVWNIDESTATKSEEFSLLTHLQRRLFAFGVVLAAVPILLVIFASRALLTAFHELLFRATPYSGVLAHSTQLVFSILVVFALTALVLRVVPDRRQDWRPILVGALLTSVAFNIGNAVVGLYLGRAATASTYGVAGALIVVPLWLRFSTSVVLVGAEFTQAYAEHRAQRRPKSPRLERTFSATGAVSSR